MKGSEGRALAQDGSYVDAGESDIMRWLQSIDERLQRLEQALGSSAGVSGMVNQRGVPRPGATGDR